MPPNSISEYLFSKCSWEHPPRSPSIIMPCMLIVHCAIQVACVLIWVATLFHIFKNVQRFCLTTVKLLPPPLRCAYTLHVFGLFICVCVYPQGCSCEINFKRLCLANPTFHQDIVLFKLPIMLLSNAPIFFLLCPNYAPLRSMNCC